MCKKGKNRHDKVLMSSFVHFKVRNGTVPVSKGTDMVPYK